MTRKIILGVLGLLLLGMLCGPVAAEPKDLDPDYWHFTIMTDVGAIIDVKLNGYGDREAGNNQLVYVSNSLDQVEVHLDVTGGPDTTLTITKDYINKLRDERPFPPALYMWGGFLTYDVDAGWVNHVGSDGREGAFFVREHLRKRGLVHKKIDKVVKSWLRPRDNPYVRIVTG